MFGRGESERKENVEEKSGEQRENWLFGKRENERKGKRGKKKLREPPKCKPP